MLKHFYKQEKIAESARKVRGALSGLWHRIVQSVSTLKTENAPSEEKESKSRKSRLLERVREGVKEPVFYILLYSAATIFILALLSGYFSWYERHVRTPNVLETPRVQTTATEQYELERTKLANYILSKNFKMYGNLAMEIADAVLQASQRWDIPAPLLLAIMDVESDYIFNASTDSSTGLMMINYSVWRADLSEAGIISSARELYNPYKNISAGAFIYKKYLDEGKDRGERNPHAYASQKYLGKTPNDHFNKMVKALGEYYLFNVGEAPTKELLVGFLHTPKPTKRKG